MIEVKEVNIKIIATLAGRERIITMTQFMRNNEYLEQSYYIKNLVAKLGFSNVSVFITESIYNRTINNKQTNT